MKDILCITILLFTPLFSGCFGGGEQVLVVVSEKAYDMVTIGISAPGAVTAQLNILYDENIVYTKNVSVVRDMANVDVRYSDFCVGNGEYRFEVICDRTKGAATYPVKKWVHSIYVKATTSNNTDLITVDLVALPAPYTGSIDGIITSGNGTWWIIGPDNSNIRDGAWSLYNYWGTTLKINKSDFVYRDGKYTIYVSFDNDCARNNKNISADPKSSNSIQLWV